MSYPPDWPRCACGDFALDGKATCGRVECGYARGLPDERIDTSEVPELGADFFENPILTRPGESVVAKTRAARMTKTRVKTRITLERAKADVATLRAMADRPSADMDDEAMTSIERELWTDVLETIAAGCNSWGAKELAKEALKTRDIEFKRG